MTLEKNVKVVFEADISDVVDKASAINKQLESANAKAGKVASTAATAGGKGGTPEQIKNLNKINNAEVKQSRLERLRSLFMDRERRKEQQHAKQTERSDRERTRQQQAQAKLQEAQNRRERQNASIRNKAGGGGVPVPPTGTTGSGGGGGGMAAGGVAAAGTGLLVSGVAAAVGAAVGYAVSTLKESYGDAVQYLNTVAELTGVEHGSLRDPRRVQQAERLGYSREDTARQMETIARATGTTNPTYLAQSLSRTGSLMSVEEQASFMGTLTRAGTTFAGGDNSQGNLGMLQVMRNAVSSGLDRSRTGEFMQATAAMIEQTSSHVMAPIDTSGITALMAAVGNLGGASWQGAAGAQLMGGIDQGLRSLGQVGNNSAASAQALQAIGYGAPGSNVTYYDALKRLQGGLFEDPEEGVNTLGQILDNATRSTSSPEERNMFLAEGIFKGMDLSQIEHIVQQFSGGPGNREEVLKLLSEFQNQTGEFATVEQKSLKVLEEQAVAANRSVGLMEDQVESIQDLQAAFREITQEPLEDCVALLSDIVDLIKSLLEGLGFDGESVSRSARTAQEVSDNIRVLANEDEFIDAKNLATVARQMGWEDSELTEDVRNRLKAGRDQLEMVRNQALAVDDPAAKARLLERISRLEAQLDTPGRVMKRDTDKQVQVDPTTVSSQPPAGWTPPGNVTTVSTTVSSGEPNSGPVITSTISSGPGTGNMSSIPMSIAP